MYRKQFIGYPRDSHVNYAHLMASIAMFPSVSKIMKSAREIFTQKKFSEYIFNLEICYRYD